MFPNQNAKKQTGHTGSSWENTSLSRDFCVELLLSLQFSWWGVILLRENSSQEVQAASLFQKTEESYLEMIDQKQSKATKGFVGNLYWKIKVVFWGRKEALESKLWFPGSQCDLE